MLLTGSMGVEGRRADDQGPRIGLTPVGGKDIIIYAIVPAKGLASPSPRVLHYTRLIAFGSIPLDEVDRAFAIGQDLAGAG